MLGSFEVIYPIQVKIYPSFNNNLLKFIFKHLKYCSFVRNFNPSSIVLTYCSSYNISSSLYILRPILRGTFDYHNRYLRPSSSDLFL